MGLQTTQPHSLTLLPLRAYYQRIMFTSTKTSDFKGLAHSLKRLSNHQNQQIRQECWSDQAGI